MSFEVGEEGAENKAGDKKLVKMDTQNFYKFWLDFILESCLEFKQVAATKIESSQDFYSLTLIKKFETAQVNALKTTKDVVKELRIKMDFPDDVFNDEMLKFARSLTAADCVNTHEKPLAVIPQLKKIFIYLRE